MYNRQPSPTPITEEEKRLALKAAFRRFAERLGVRPDLFDSKVRFGQSSQLSDEEQHELAKAMALQIVQKSVEENLLSDIQTRRISIECCNLSMQNWSRLLQLLAIQSNASNLLSPDAEDLDESPNLTHQNARLCAKKF